MSAQVTSKERAHALAKQIYLGLDPRYPDRWYDHIVSVLTPTTHETCDIRIENLTRALHAKQAKIDALMLEFCPGEMSAEQRAEWATHQQPSTNTTSAAAKAVGAQEAGRFTPTYTADNVDSKGVAAVGRSYALGDPCPVCASGRIGQSGYNFRCANCGWLGPRMREPNAQKACEAPPVDNDHVADGCGKFDV